MTAPRVSPKVRDRVYARDKHRCVRCGKSTSLQLHHRLPKRAGGCKIPAINLEPNLITVCGLGNTSGCHGHIESHRLESIELGYLIRSLDEATTTPVLYGIERSLYLLEEDGSKTWLEEVTTNPLEVGRG